AIHRKANRNARLGTCRLTTLLRSCDAQRRAPPASQRPQISHPIWLLRIGGSRHLELNAHIAGDLGLARKNLVSNLPGGHVVGAVGHFYFRDASLAGGCSEDSEPQLDRVVGGGG